MAQVKRLTLKDYKTWKDQTFEFESLTAIKGLNLSGKTNALRGLVMVLFNGDFPLKHIRGRGKLKDVAKGSVEVELDNGYTLKRERSKSGQTLTVTYPEGNSKVFLTVKDMTDVVQKITGFAPVKLGSDDKKTNLQYKGARDAKGFLTVGVSAETVLKYITKLMSKHNIESAKAKLESQLRSKNAEVKFNQNRVETQTILVRGLNENLLHKKQEQLEALKDKEKKLVALAYKIESINRLVSLHNQHSALSKRLTKIERRLNDLREGVSVADSNERLLQNQINSLSQLISYIGHEKELNESLAFSKQNLETLQKQYDALPKCQECGQPL